MIKSDHPRSIILFTPKVKNFWNGHGTVKGGTLDELIYLIVLDGAGPSSVKGIAYRASNLFREWIIVWYLKNKQTNKKPSFDSK